MSWLFFIIVFGYALTILLLSKEQLTYTTTSIDADSKKLPFTIIVNYRNEEECLPVLLLSIKNQNYDFKLLQWIFVNDNSTDQSLKILETFKNDHSEIDIYLVNRKTKSSSGKKDGISQAIELSLYDRIITTDADCRLPCNWISSYNASYLKNNDAHFIAAPINIEQDGTVLSTLQQQEMIALQLITAGSFSFRQPFMCNGANMSFTKDAFYEVDGYEGNTHISSGDDIFLLEKLAAEDVMKCHYLKSKEAIVTTFPKKSLNETILQRARWAQKGSETKSLLSKLMSFQIIMMSLLFILSPVLWFFSVITSQMFIGAVLVKLFTDGIVLVIGNQFFRNVKWNFVLINFILYPFLVIAIALKSLSKFQWKGRNINDPMNLQD